MEKKFFRNLVIAGFFRSLTLSVTGLIDCAVVGRNIGLRIIFTSADEVRYNSSMNLNNVCIRINWTPAE